MRARIDTGAKTTALHAYNIVVETDDTGRDFITFNTHPENRRRKDSPRITLPLIDKRKIMSSNGVREERYIVKVDIKIGDVTLKTDMTLTSRHKMSFPLLVGRNTLTQAKYVVDVAKVFCLGKPPRHS